MNRESNKTSHKAVQAKWVGERDAKQQSPLLKRKLLAILGPGIKSSALLLEMGWLGMAKATLLVVLLLVLVLVLQLLKLSRLLLAAFSMAVQSMTPTGRM